MSISPEATEKGTSPRMRGKQVAGVDVRVMHRNIPAYAGKTCLTQARLTPPAEHPRVCGENPSL